MSEFDNCAARVRAREASPVYGEKIIEFHDEWLRIMAAEKSIMGPDAPAPLAMFPQQNPPPTGKLPCSASWTTRAFRLMSGHTAICCVGDKKESTPPRQEEMVAMNGSAIVEHRLNPMRQKAENEPALAKKETKASSKQGQMMSEQGPTTANQERKAAEVAGSAA